MTEHVTGRGVEPTQRSNPAAGGCLLALGVIGGLLYALFVGSSSLAILVGTAIGIVLATLVFLRDRVR